GPLAGLDRRRRRAAGPPGALAGISPRPRPRPARAGPGRLRRGGKMSEPATPRAHVALLTADSPGAIAVHRVGGPDARARPHPAFRPRSRPGLARTPAGRPRLGRLGDGLGDEVVAVIVPGEPPEVEVQGHGGPAATRLVADALIRAGASPATAEAWARRGRR